MKKNENGRSIVEMLGVLAIIGILSITGIYGYITAMRRHRANEIIRIATILKIQAQSMNGGSGDCITLSSSEFSEGFTGGNVEIVAEVVNESITTVTIQLDDEADCDLIHAIEPTYTCGTALAACSS